jgi:hypothetical protein
MRRTKKSNNRDKTKKDFKNRPYPLKIEETMRGRPGIYIDKGLLLQEGATIAIIYGELLSRYRYFADRGDLTEDGCFFNTMEDLKSAVGYGCSTQWAAIKRLQELGLVISEPRGLPAKRYFKIVDISEDALPPVPRKKEGKVCTRTPRSKKLENSGTEVNNNNYNKNKNKRDNYTPDGETAQTTSLPLDTDEPPTISLDTNLPSTKSLDTRELEEKSPSRKVSGSGADQIALPSREILEEFIVEEPPEKEPPGKITPRYIYMLFKQKYVEKYKRYPNNRKPAEMAKILGIINSAFLKKYGGERAVEILLLLFKHYEELDIDRTNFPRPELSTLTQDWIINKLLDYVESRKKIDEYERNKREAAEEVSPRGDYTPYTEFPRRWNRILNNGPHYGIRLLAKYGYLPPDWFDRFDTDNEYIMDTLRKGIRIWNERNPGDQMDPLS